MSCACLDTRSGVSPYLQLIHQVRQALRLGLLSEGDQLPTVKDVVARLAINPNTVLKAYRELEYEGLAAAKAGVGTFVTRTDGSLAAHGPLREDLTHWLAKARTSGLDDESIEALFVTTFRNSTSSARNQAGNGAAHAPADSTPQVTGPTGHVRSE
ncbi:MAG TPA: GntR family transcriptional regulator [Streptosporangiaceae bacterium]|nr:GntR family transcriptional regulator [Streptosporangiaceae bacterium]